ncbi:MAG TPA: ubiquinol oxidase subunit II [Candidatus Binatia bacterium]|nr:ubiquinol oxidase subunit II [Candidatus Binatia bacterium]
MDRKNKNALFGLAVLAVVCLAVILLRDSNIAVLNPRGLIASKERNLIIISTLLMLIVVIPVYVMTFTIAWKYRESNKKAKYQPDWDHDSRLEFTWWAVPFVIIAILSVITWNSSHQLDPSQAIYTGKQPLTIQVVSMQWKWLFIYPKQNVATVNYFQIPINTPVEFQITSDAPMNSFWIPQLGGQIYAMPGMSTTLHLEASQLGSYDGSSANISGRGFSAMRFTVQANNPDDFNQWLQGLKSSPAVLSNSAYNQLAKPTVGSPVIYYSSTAPALYDRIILKFMAPPGSGQDLEGS